MKKVSIIIVNWNGITVLPDCLDSILRIHSTCDLELVIVDNNSNDSSVESIQSYRNKLKRKKIDFKIVENAENRGFAEGNNIGYETSTGDYLLFLNSDTTVEPDFLDPLIKKIKVTNVGAVQPLMLQLGTDQYIDSIGSYFLTTGFLYHKGHNKQLEEKYLKSDFIFSMKGACMLIKREVIDTVSLFDTDYFAYFEETDLCHRILLAGYTIRYCPESIIHHKGGTTANYLPSGFILYHSYKNRIYTYLKNFQIKTLFQVMPIHIALCEIISVLYLITGKFSLFIALQKALLWNVLHIAKILRNRARVQKDIRTVSDEDYLTKTRRKVRPSYYYHLFTSSLRGYAD